MSRCFPFPPPNYLKNAVGGDALLTQLKHQRRKARKERKRRRKLELNENEAGMEWIDHDDKKHENGKDKFGDDNSSKCELPAEKFPTSSDEEVEFLQENFTHVINGKKDFSVTAVKLSTSPHANGNENENFPAEKFPRAAAENFSASPQKIEFECDTYSIRKGKLAPNEKNFMLASMSTSETSMLKTEEEEYRKLIVNWVPPPLQLVQTEFADEEWLYGKNVSGSKRSKTKHVGNNGIYQGVQPQAHYLADADIYALPYSLPF